MNVKRFSLHIILSLFLGLCAFYPFAEVAAEHQTALDVDSLGDIWIFTLDKSGSMLKDQTSNVNRAKYLSPRDIADQIMDSLSKSGILNCIDYSRDKITIFETGYGQTSTDSYGTPFDKAAPLKESFLHLQPNYSYVSFATKLKLCATLRNLLQNGTYPYRESFISQIRVLALAREIEFIEQQGLNNAFRFIHIVTITDDADDNDQWLKDYYSIKQRSLKKHKELNALQSKYMYNQLSQRGGGQMEEDMRYSMAHPMSKFKVHVYHYTTLQQVCDSAHFIQNDFVQCSPLDGNSLTLKPKKQYYESDPISFVYVDEIVINNKHYPLHTYLSRKNDLQLTYTYKQINNAIRINGQIQVSYQDSIYGSHYRKIPFEQSFTLASATSHRRSMIALLVLIGALCAFIIWLLFVLPYGRLMTVYQPSGQTFKVRRGYTFRWGRSINPLAYIVGTARSHENRDLIAKHRCVRLVSTAYSTTNDRGVILIDSTKPLTLSQSMSSIDTTMEIHKFIQRHPDQCPEALKLTYSKMGLKTLDKWSDCQMSIMRKIGQRLRRVYVKVCPHYWYWINTSKLVDSLVLRHETLMSRPMIIEYREVSSYVMNAVDTQSRILSQYYRDEGAPLSDVVIGINKRASKWEWHVIQLHVNLSLGSGISEVKEHLYHVTDVCDDITYINTLNRLKQAIRKELKLKRISVVELKESDDALSMPFVVGKNIFSKYLYMVEDTEKQKAIRVYSPFSDKLDEKSSSRMIMLPNRKYDMEIYTSLIPIHNAKDIPAQGIARRESKDKYPAGPATQGLLKTQKTSISIINMTIPIN